MSGQGFVVERVTLGEVFLLVLPFCPSRFYPTKEYSILIHLSQRLYNLRR